MPLVGEHEPVKRRKKLRLKHCKIACMFDVLTNYLLCETNITYRVNYDAEECELSIEEAELL